MERSESVETSLAMGGSRSELLLSLRKVAGERPAKRSSGEVPEADEAKDRAAQLANAIEAAVLEHAALEDREPDLDLVDPGRVNRRVHEMKAAAVPAVEARPAAVAAVVVDVEIVPDDVDLLARVAL